MNFCPPPKRILTDAETLALAAPELSAEILNSPDRYRIKSPLLYAFMDKLEERGFVYNHAAQLAFEKAYNLPASNKDGEPGNGALHVLVYNCQQYRRHDRLVRDGWQPGSPEMLQEAFQKGHGIAVMGENMLGGNVQEVFKVREIGGKLYAMRPHKRKYAINIAGRPCKVMPLPSTAKAIA